MPTVIPDFSGLFPLIGMKFRFDKTLSVQPNSADLQEAGCAATLTSDGDSVLIEKRVPDGAGLWVPYIASCAVVGTMTGSQTWVASGPFSGCEFVVGKNKRAGVVYAAHLARDGNDSAVKKAYNDYRNANDLSEWYWNRIPMPNAKAFSASYVFVLCGGGGILHMTRVDVDVTAMGGYEGTIKNVHKFK